MRSELVEKFVASGKSLRKRRCHTTKLLAGDEAKRQADTLEITLPSTGRLFKYVISDSTEDRHGDTIAPDGWQLKTFEKSAAVLWAHQHREPPVQTTKKVWLEDQKLMAIAQEFEKGINPFADMISEMVARGYIKMTSVGFLPFEYEIREGHEDDWWPPIDFLKQELTEYSIVSSGSNRNAFLEDMPEHNEALKQFVAQVLDGEKEVDASTKEQLEEVHEKKYRSKFYQIQGSEVADALRNMFSAK